MLMKEDPSNCIFCEFFAGRSPVSMIWEDDRVAVFVPFKPVNRGHALVVPKVHAPYLADLDGDLAAHIMGIAQRTSAAIRASDLKCEGINLFLADGESAGQEVFHFHLHVYPRFSDDGFGFKYDARHFADVSRQEMDRLAALIRMNFK
jgi:histidine triad (HIT) family protein